MATLAQVRTDERTAWPRVRGWGYDGRWRGLEVSRATAVWARLGQPGLPMRWVVGRHPTGKLAPRVYLATSPCERARASVVACIKRWPLETTVDESHAHRGVATHRPGADQAIERLTPCLVGLDSLGRRLAQALSPNGLRPFQPTAGYAKSQATCADAWAAVRRQRWSADGDSPSAQAADLVDMPKAALERLLSAVCYAH